MRKLYESGRFNSVQFLLAHRDDILNHTGLLVPQRPDEAEEWWDDNKATFARKINKGDSDGESENDSDESDNE